MLLGKGEGGGSTRSVGSTCRVAAHVQDAHNPTWEYPGSYPGSYPKSYPPKMTTVPYIFLNFYDKIFEGTARHQNLEILTEHKPAWIM